MLSNADAELLEQKRSAFVVHKVVVAGPALVLVAPELRRFDEQVKQAAERTNFEKNATYDSKFIICRILTCNFCVSFT